ncbi:MAG: hypothetical protein IIC39_00580 [Candidatus Marinimicrobia bacterium]|nr:hypothetical protein [Candidatus Neomarinimicrobiota bacterium]
MKKKEERTGIYKIFTNAKMPKKKVKSTMKVIKITAYNIPTEDEPRVIIKKTGGKPKLIKK